MDEEQVKFLQHYKCAIHPPSCPPLGNDSVLNQEDGDSALLQHTLERDGVLIIIKENIYVFTADLGGNIVLFNEEYSSVTMLILSFIQLHHHQKFLSEFYFYIWLVGWTAKM